MSTVDDKVERMIKESFTRQKTKFGSKQVAAKEKAGSMAIRAIFEKYHQKEGTILTEEIAPHTPESEGEPSRIEWSAASPDLLKNGFKGKTITDVETTISAALMQPGVPFGILLKDQKGTSIFIKSDKQGALYSSAPVPDSKVFSNPGLGPDGDTDEDDAGFSHDMNTDASFGVSNKNCGNNIKESKSIKGISLEEMFWNSQTKLKQTKSEEVENLTEELADAIAQELLSNKKVNNQKINELYEKYLNIV